MHTLPFSGEHKASVYLDEENFQRANHYENMPLSGTLSSPSGLMRTGSWSPGGNWKLSGIEWTSKHQAINISLKCRMAISSCPVLKSRESHGLCTICLRRDLMQISAGESGMGQDRLPQWSESQLRNMSGLTRSHVQLPLKALEALQPLNLGKH